MCVFCQTFAAQRYNFFPTGTRKHAKIFIFCFYLHYFKDHFVAGRRFWFALLTKVVLRKWLHVSGFAYRVIYLMLILCYFVFVSRGQANDQVPEGGVCYTFLLNTNSQSPYLTITNYMDSDT